jgi:amino acid permease
MWARRAAVQSALICLVLLVVIACVWGTQHLLLCTAVAAGAAVMLFAIRCLWHVTGLIKEARSALISSPFRIPPQDSHISGS